MSNDLICRFVTKIDGDTQLDLNDQSSYWYVDGSEFPLPEVLYTWVQNQFGHGKRLAHWTLDGGTITLKLCIKGSSQQDTYNKLNVLLNRLLKENTLELRMWGADVSVFYHTYPALPQLEDWAKKWIIDANYMTNISIEIPVDPEIKTSQETLWLLRALGLNDSFEKPGPATGNFDNWYEVGCGGGSVSADEVNFVDGEVACTLTTAPEAVTRYTLTAHTDYPTSAPNDWTFQGSNNDVDWTTLDTQTDIVFAAGETKTFDFANVNTYTYFKLDVTANNGHATFLSLAEMTISVGAGDDYVPIMTSGTTPAPVVVTQSTFHIIAGGGGSIEFKAWRCFDDGAESGASYWRTYNGNTTGWLKVYVPSCAYIQDDNPVYVDETEPHALVAWAKELSGAPSLDVDLICYDSDGVELDTLNLLVALNPADTEWADVMLDSPVVYESTSTLEPRFPAGTTSVKRIIRNDATVSSAITLDNLWFGSVKHIPDSHPASAMGIVVHEGEVKGNLPANADVHVTSTTFKGPWSLQDVGIEKLLHDVEIVSPSLAWAIDGEGPYSEGNKIYVYNGSSWELVDFESAPLFGISAYDANNVWAVGANGQIVYYNGTIWAEQTCPALADLTFPDYSVEGTFVTYWETGGTGGTITQSSTKAHQGTYSIKNVLAVGSAHNCYVHGKTTNLLSFNPNESGCELHVWRWKPAATYGGWKLIAEFYDENKSYLGYLDSGIKSSYQSAWVEDTFALSGIIPEGTRYIGPKILWYDSAGGPGDTEYFDEFHLERTGMPFLYGVYAVSATTVVTVGQFGSIFKTTDSGTTWTQQMSTSPPTMENLWDVTAADSTHWWAVGTNGTILFSADGSTWTLQNSGSTEDLYGVWALDATNVWACGTNGTILYFNGTAWTPQTSGTSNRLTGVHGLDGTHVYACGWSGTLLAFDGTNWTKQSAGTDEYLYGIFAYSEIHVRAVGDNGTMLLGVAPSNTLPCTNLILGQSDNYSEDWNPVLDAVGATQVASPTRRGGLYREMVAEATEVFRFDALAHKGRHMVTAGVSFGAETDYDQLALTYKLQTSDGTDITTQTTTDEVDCGYSSGDTRDAEDWLEVALLPAPRLSSLTIPSQGVSENAELSNLKQVVVVTADASLATEMWLDYLALIPVGQSKVEISDWAYNTLILDSRSLKAVLASLDNSLDTAQIYDPTKCLGIPRFTANPDGANYTIVCVNTVSGDDQATFIPDIKLIYNPTYVLVGGEE